MTSDRIEPKKITLTSLLRVHTQPKILGQRLGCVVVVGCHVDFFLFNENRNNQLTKIQKKPFFWPKKLILYVYMMCI